MLVLGSDPTRLVSTTVALHCVSVHNQFAPAVTRNITAFELTHRVGAALASNLQTLEMENR